VNGNRLLDFGGDRDHDANPGIFNAVLQCEIVPTITKLFYRISCLGRVLRFASASFGFCFCLVAC